jgi:hypothetical protein
MKAITPPPAPERGGSGVEVDVGVAVGGGTVAVGDTSVGGGAVGGSVGDSAVGAVTAVIVAVGSAGPQPIKRRTNVVNNRIFFILRSFF